MVERTQDEFESRSNWRTSTTRKLITTNSAMHTDLLYALNANKVTIRSNPVADFEILTGRRQSYW